MIRHVVLIRPAASALPPDIEAAMSLVSALKGVVPGIIDINTGANVSPEGLGRGYSHGFVVDFVDEEARDAYLPHPAHQKAGGALVAVAEGGLDGILVFDLSIPS